MAGGNGFFLLGFVSLFISLLIVFLALNTLTKDQVVDDWSILIENGQGNADAVLQNTQGFIKDSKVPDVLIEGKQIAPGLLRGAMGAKRAFLVLTETQNIRLAPYQMFLNCRDYGNNLAVNWYLTFRPSFWQALPSVLLGRSGVKNPLIDLDLFDQQDLRAYVTNAHRCMIKAVEKLMAGLNQDTSKIDRKSRGFLGIS